MKEMCMWMVSYPPFDDIFFFLVYKEIVELVNLELQESKEVVEFVGIQLGWSLAIFGTHNVQLFLQDFVAQEFVAPIRQRLLNQPLQDLLKLHVNANNLLITKQNDVC